MRRVSQIEARVAHLVGPGKLHLVNRQLTYSPASRTRWRGEDSRSDNLLPGASGLDAAGLDDADAGVDVDERIALDVTSAPIEGDATAFGEDESEPSAGSPDGSSSSSFLARSRPEKRKSQRLRDRSAETAASIRLPADALEVIYCYGKIAVTDEAMRWLFEQGISVSWMTPAGVRCQGRLVAGEVDSAAARIVQYRVLMTPAARLELAREIVREKLRSQHDAARHYQRQGRDSGIVSDVLRQLKHLHKETQRAEDLGALRGIEGAAAVQWFRCFATLLDPPWNFSSRVRRPPTDPVNALLSLGYTFLLQRVLAKVQARGLEAQLGALHEYRAGRPSLACDLMEPFRVTVVDRWVLSVLNRKLLSTNDFQANEESAGIRLKPEVFGRIVSHWEQHWIQGGHERAFETFFSDWLRRLRRFTQGSPTGDFEWETPDFQADF